MPAVLSPALANRSKFGMILEALDFNIAGIVISIISIVLAVMFYRRQKTKQQIGYRIESYGVVGPSTQISKDLRLYYKGRSIPLVTRTTITIWNNGNQKIDATDFAPREPLRIQLDDSSAILEVQEINATSEVIGFTLRPDSESLSIIFDFLAPNDGAQFSFLHTGRRIAVKGALKIGRLDEIDEGRSGGYIIWVLGFLFIILLSALSELVQADMFVSSAHGDPLLPGTFEMKQIYLLGIAVAGALYLYIQHRLDRQPRIFKRLLALKKARSQRSDSNTNREESEHSRESSPS